MLAGHFRGGQVAQRHLRRKKVGDILATTTLSDSRALTWAAISVWTTRGSLPVSMTRCARTRWTREYHVFFR